MNATQKYDDDEGSKHSDRQQTCNQRIHGGVFALWGLYHRTINRHLGDTLMGIDVRKCH